MFIKRLIYRFLEHRHYWRYGDFSEMAELYASRVLRLMAVSMVGVLVIIYLYQLGYSFAFIMFYCSLYFVARGLCTFPSAKLVARVGPKHGMLISNLLYVPGLAAFGIFQAISVSLYDIAHFVDFSKVKHNEHVGKELGFMSIVDRLSTSLSPLIGGVIAYYFGPQATMWAAALIFAIAAAPLLFSPEPTRTHQQIIFRHFNWRRTWRGMAAEAGAGVDFVISGGIWSLYIAVAVLGTTSNIVYAQIGALATVTIFASLVFAKAFGRLIDRRKGGILLTYSVIANSLLHVFRPFATTVPGVAFVNVVNQAVTNGYNMPFIRGMFDVADSLPGLRIVYLSYMELALCVGAAAFFAVLGVIGLYVAPTLAMQIGFVIAGILTTVIAFHGFPALRTGKL
jgi:MFS family permease